MRSESPVVSVIVPVYNRAERVVSAIDSIVGQTFENWELIAVDDGSTDETPAALRACAEKDSRLRIIRQENKGVAAARNAALRAARGEIVSLQDSDDASLPSLLQNGVDFLRANPKIAGLHQRMKNSDSKGRSRGFAYLNKWQTLRISAARSVGGYREFFVGSEDSDFNCRLEECGYRAATSRHVLMRACRHQGARLSMSERSGAYSLIQRVCAAQRRLGETDFVDQGKTFSEIMDILHLRAPGVSADFWREHVRSRIVAAGKRQARIAALRGRFADAEKIIDNLRAELIRCGDSNFAASASARRIRLSLRIFFAREKLRAVFE